MVVENSGGDANTQAAGAGVGLQNVRRRLEICYGSGADLEVRFEPGYTSVELNIPLVRSGIGEQDYKKVGKS